MSIGTSAATFAVGAIAGRAVGGAVGAAGGGDAAVAISRTVTSRVVRETGLVDQARDVAERAAGQELTIGDLPL